MSTVTLASNNGVLQGFSSPFTSSTNPSGASLTRRGRLARTLFVASLTVVLAAGFAAQSGAGDEVVATTSYVSVVVPGGEKLPYKHYLWKFYCLRPLHIVGTIKHFSRVCLLSSEKISVGRVGASPLLGYAASALLERHSP